ncbi:hypothetical protein L218DRAFT_798221, partial [Marasmius fiardii PR-910]
TNEDRLDKYLTGLDKACGLISMAIDSSQKPHVAACRDDPKKMMAVLRGVHIQQQAGNRFNALNDLLSIQKGEDETLSTLIGRASDAIQFLHDLTPTTIKTEADVLLGNSGTPYTLQDLYDDLECMALIRSLPPKYDPLTRPLLVSKDLSTQKVREAYHAEE